MSHRQLPDYERCMHTTRDGRRCRKGRLTDAVTLCYYHQEMAEKDAAQAAQRTQLLAARAQIGAELFPRRESFNSAASISRFIGRVARHVANGRIDPRIGTSLAYIAQVALTTLAQRRVERAEAQAASQAAAPSHPMFDSGELSQIDALIKSIEANVDPDSPPSPDSAESSSSEAAP